MANKFYRAVIVLLFLSMMGVILGMTSPGLADTDLDVVGTGVHLPVIAIEALVYLVLLVRLCTRPQHYLRAASRMVTLLPLLTICLTVQPHVLEVQRPPPGSGEEGECEHLDTLFPLLLRR